MAVITLDTTQYTLDTTELTLDGSHTHGPVVDTVDGGFIHKSHKIKYDVYVDGYDPLAIVKEVKEKFKKAKKKKKAVRVAEPDQVIEESPEIWIDYFNNEASNLSRKKEREEIEALINKAMESIQLRDEQILEAQVREKLRLKLVEEDNQMLLLALLMAA